MAEFLVDFEWVRDRKGYELAEAMPPKPGEPFIHPLFGPQEPTLLCGTPGTPERVIRRGGPLEPYRPLDMYPTLYSNFATKARDTEGVLDFVNKFGALFYKEAGDPIVKIIEHANAMYTWQSFSSDTETLRSVMGNEPFRLFNPEVSLIIDPITAKPKLRICPASLLEALWLQFGQRIAGGVKVKACLQCGQLFEAGQGTGRREDSKFCCDQHRIAFNSDKRSRQ